MPALTPTQAAAWRSAPYWSRGWLYVHKPAVLARATISQTSVSYPVAEVAVTWTENNQSAVPTGCTVLFGSAAGLDDLGRQRVRKAPTADTVYIGWSSLGGRPGEVVVGTGVHLTFLDLREPWAVAPAPDPSSGEIRKDYDIPPGDYGSYPAPIANAGAYFCDWANASGYCDVDCSGDDSVGEGALSYTWDIADGALQSGTLGSRDITVRFTEGARYIRLTVNDGHHSAYTDVLVVVLGETTRPVKAGLSNRTIRPRGQTISFNLYEDLPASDYPDGTVAIYIEEEHFGDQAGGIVGPDGREQVKFVGWLNRSEAGTQGSEAGAQHRSQIVFEDLAERLRGLPGFAQTVRNASSPSSWREMQNPYLHDYLRYLLVWHSNAAQIADLIVPTLGYPFPALESGEASLYDQVDSLAQSAYFHGLTCSPQGALRVAPNPLYQNESTRDATAVVITLDENDYSAIDFARQPHPTVHWVHASGIKAVGDIAEVNQGYFAAAPGHAPGQGVAKQQLAKQLLSSFTPQEDLNYRVARYYAQLNNPYTPIRLSLAHPGDFIDPSLMEWVEVTLPAGYAADRGLSFDARRALVSEVRLDYGADGVKRAVLTLIPEAEEIAGSVTIVQDNFYGSQDLAVDWGGANIPHFDLPYIDFDWETPELSPTAVDWPSPVAQPWLDPADRDALAEAEGVKTPGKLALLDLDGDVFVWDGSRSGGDPVWRDASTGLSGDCVRSVTTGDTGDLVYDPLSDVHVACTTEGVFTCADLYGASPSWTQVLDYVTDGYTAGDAIIKLLVNERVEGHWVGVAASGDIFVTADAGSTWTLYDIGMPNPSDETETWPVTVTDLAIAPAWLDPDENVVCCAGVTGTAQVWGRSRDGGATWEEWAEAHYLSVDASNKHPSIHLPLRRPDTGALNVDGDFARISGGREHVWAEYNKNYRTETTDGGATWALNNLTHDDLPVNFGLQDDTVHVWAGWAVDAPDGELLVGLGSVGFQEQYTYFVENDAAGANWDGDAWQRANGIMGYRYNGQVFLRWDDNKHLRLTENGGVAWTDYWGNLDTVGASANIRKAIIDQYSWEGSS